MALQPKWRPDVARHRESGGLAPVYGNYDTLNADCSHLYLWHRNGPIIKGWTGTTYTTDDWVTPGYLRRVKEGEVIIKPYKHVEETHATSGDSHWMESVNYSCTSPSNVKASERLSGPWIYPQANAGATKLSPVYLINEDTIASLVALASTSMWSNSNAATAGVLQDIAEMRQTLAMLNSPIKQQFALLRKIIKRGKGGKHSLSLGAVHGWATQNWLQYRYGVRPLISSVQGVLEAVKAKAERHRWTARGNSSYSLTQASSGTLSGFLAADISWSRFDADTVTVRAGALLEEVVTMAQNLGFTGGQLLALPWELVPYSFVADWFANVGQFLQGVVPYVSKKALGTWYVVRRVQTSSWNVTNTVSSSPSTYSVQKPATEFRTLVYKTTERFTPAAAPSVVLRPGSLGKVFSDLRVVDSWFLLMQQMNRVFRG